MAIRLSTGIRNKLLGINPEKVTAGTFETDAATQDAWTESVSTMLGGVAGGQSGYQMTLTNAGYTAQPVTTKVGHLYTFSVYFNKGAGTSGYIKLGTSADDDTYYGSGAITDATWTQYTVRFVATTTSTYITLGCGAADTVGYDTASMVSESRSVQDIFNGGEIRIYSGTQPTSADDAPTGTLLCTIKKDGTDGISFDDAASGVLSKASAETWQGTVPGGTNGTAGWARLMHADDSLGSSLTDERIDMSVATSGAQLNFSSTTFAAGAVQTITTFAITFPAQ